MKTRCITLLLCLTCLTGCQTLYYAGMEKVGVHKRDILTDRVKDARDSQEDAKEQFKDALEEFSAVVKFDGGDLQQQYDKLSSSFAKSEQRAKDVSARIDSVESVSKALFKEWEAELKQYASASLRSNSEQQLAVTKKDYGVMIDAMRKAEQKMEPVLSAFRDQVLFLKHNLNARAIASLETELASVETDIGALIKEMESSIREADSFIQSMSK